MGFRSRTVLAMMLSVWAHSEAARGGSPSGKIEERWSVVGVIAGEANANHEPTGIAVLRNNVSQKSYTLTIGDPVPTEFGFVLKQVLARSVLIANSETEVTLGFTDEPVAEVTADSRDTQPGRTSRFLENYYRGFDAGSDEAFDDGSSDDVEVPPGVVVPHIGVPRLERPNHLGVYRGARPYRFDEDESEAPSGAATAAPFEDDDADAFVKPQD